MLGSELLVAAMKMSGVETVFSLSGNQIMPIYDACLDPGIRIVHSRHESATIFMADAHAQLSDSPAVALVTAAPGFANALGGLYSALLNESPIVFLTGDSPTSLDGKRAFQEFPQSQAVNAFVKHTERVVNVDDIAAAWHRCFYVAFSGRPGPVHLSIPFDILCTETSARPDDQASTDAHAKVSALFARFEPGGDDIESIISALAGSKKPLVITGPAMSSSRLPELIQSLQECLQAPLLCMESPRGLNDPSLGDLRAIVKQADCVVLMGKLPDFTLAFGNPYDLPAETLVVIEPDPDEFEKSLKILEGRDRIVINALVRELAHVLVMSNPSMPNRSAWIDEVKSLLRTAPILDAEDSTGLLPSRIGLEVQQAIDDAPESIVICDGGEFGQWAQACTEADARIINGPSGAIGGSLPNAIGASIARPDATVFVLCGDGTVGFHLAEIETAVRESTPFILIIGNDSCWNAEHQIQLNEYGADRAHSCQLGESVRYDIAAIGLGAKGFLVSDAKQLQDALTQAVSAAKNHAKPSCINVIMTGRPAPIFRNPNSGSQ